MQRHAGLFASTIFVAMAAPFALAGGTNAGTNGAITAQQQLLDTYPGARVYQDGAKVILYGVPMTGANSAQEAADAFLAQHGDAFGIVGLQLEQLWASDLSFGRSTSFGYRQLMNGLVVENSVARVLVNNDIGHKVVLAAGTLAATPEGGLPAALITNWAAIAVAQSDPAYTHLPDWSEAELVVYAGANLDQTATPAWKFFGDNNDLAHRERYAFFVNATNGVLLDVRNEVHFTDVVGSIKGMGSPGTKPDEAINPPTTLNIPEIRMTVTGGSNAFSDRNGNFTIPNGGTSPVTVTTNASAGRWVNVNPAQGAEISLSGSYTPGVSQTMTMNSTPTAFNTAQVNALIHVDGIHNYYRDRGGPAGLDIVIPCAVNIASTCNAYYSASTINFYAIGGGCNNTAYSTVIAHEYGHFVVDKLGLAQGSFGEGFGDTSGMLLFDDPIVGDDFLTNGGNVREPLTDNVQYPCASEIHTCGEVVAGVWYRIRQNFGTQYGSAPGLALVQQLEVDWANMTNGGSGNDSAYPGTAIEVLTVDDDNGNIGDGTPNYSLICPAFDAHNIDCPALTLMTFQYPDGIPTQLVPNQVTTFRVNAVGVNGGVPVPGSGQIVYSINGGAFGTVNMTEVTANNYVASIPALACPSSVSFYVKARVNTSIVVSDPSNAPASTRTALAVTGTSVLFSDDFTTNKGWTLGGVAGDAATTGRWNRMVSQSTWGTQPAGGRSGAADLCAVTDGNAGGGVGTFDVDTGKTTLISPAFNLAGTDAKIGYWRWFSNDQGSNPGTMSFVVDVSNNGTSWVNVETVGPTGTEAHAGWFYHEFMVSTKVAPTATVTVRFIATDTIGSIVEAAVDDVSVTTFSCAPACPNPGCTGFDVDGDCVVALTDLAELLAVYGTSGPNLPGDTASPFGTIDLSDLSLMLANYGLDCN